MAHQEPCSCASEEHCPYFAWPGCVYRLRAEALVEAVKDAKEDALRGSSEPQKSPETGTTDGAGAAIVGAEVRPLGPSALSPLQVSTVLLEQVLRAADPLRIIVEDLAQGLTPTEAWRKEVLAEWRKVTTSLAIGAASPKDGAA